MIKNYLGQQCVLILQVCEIILYKIIILIRSIYDCDELSNEI